MAFPRIEDAADRAFREEALQRIEETRGLWTSFVATRPLHLVGAPNGLPAFEGTVENTRVSVTAAGSIELGFRTRAVTDAKIAMRGWVAVAPPGEWDELVSQLPPRARVQGRRDQPRVGRRRAELRHPRRRARRARLPRGAGRRALAVPLSVAETS